MYLVCIFSGVSRHGIGHGIVTLTSLFSPQTKIIVKVANKILRTPTEHSLMFISHHIECLYFAPLILRNTVPNAGQQRSTSWSDSESSKENGNPELQQSKSKRQEWETLTDKSDIIINIVRTEAGL